MCEYIEEPFDIKEYFVNYVEKPFIEEPFYNCVKKNNLSKLKKYYKKMNEKNKAQILTNTFCFCIWDFVVENKNIEIIKWLSLLPDVDIHHNHEKGFRMLCCYGKLELAQWLFSHFPNINIHACEDEAFRQACEGGHFDTVIWLYSIGEIDIHACKNYAFTMSCKYGYFKIVDWLLMLR